MACRKSGVQVPAGPLTRCKRIHARRIRAGLDGLTIASGDEVELTMANDGPADHELEVFGPDGEVIDEIEPVHAGKTGKLTLTFDRSGTYEFVCGLSDH